jgi:hypothetical protein
MISLLIFAGGILIWKQLSSLELKVPANQLTSITYEGMSFDFIYHPDSGKISTNESQQENDSFPANVGFGWSWSGGGFTVTEVNADYVVLYFKPWRFTTVDDVTT